MIINIYFPKPYYDTVDSKYLVRIAHSHEWILSVCVQYCMLERERARDTERENNVRDRETQIGRHPHIHAHTHTLLCLTEFCSCVWIRLVSQCAFLFSADNPISVVFMQQIDSLQLTIHHLVHQNLLLPPLHQWKCIHTFSKKTNKTVSSNRYCLVLLEVLSCKLFYFVSKQKWKGKDANRRNLKLLWSLADNGEAKRMIRSCLSQWKNYVFKIIGRNWKEFP